MTSFLKDSFHQAIEQGDWHQALSRLRQFFAASQNLVGAQVILDQMEKLKKHLPTVPYRLAFLRSFTLEPVVPLVQAHAFLHAIDLKVEMGDFNTYAQEMLDPESKLYRWEPQAVILAIQTRDLVPALWDGFSELSSADRKHVVEETVQNLKSWIAAFRSHSKASLILHTFELPERPEAGVLDTQAKESQTEAIQRLNQEVRKIARDRTGVYVLDYDALVSRFGRSRWHDERKWLTVRMPMAADALNSLAEEYLRFILPLTGRVCKALVVDLDNTLWGGVVGEESLEKLQIGTEYPEAAYLALQRAIQHLGKRGILLAIASKNNPRDALEVLEKHPAMLLRPKDFAAVRINWNDKVQSLREIASELNIGTDALAFLDDNPIEREWVRSQLPEVTVIDLPTDPMGYRQALLDCPVFERLTLSEEDQARSRYYVEEIERKELRTQSSSLEDFYASLKMEAEIVEVGSDSFARVAQLTQKTNQFNLTTRRFSEPEIRAYLENPHAHGYVLRAYDRFGECGLVGVALTHDEEDQCEIRTFLLSCRAIGRTLETALLSHVAREAAARGVRVLKGRYLPTKKNAPAKDFYPRHQFKLMEDNDGKALWSFELASGVPPSPPWISLRTPSQETV